MRQPIAPRMGEDVKAEHLRSHAQAIEWLYSRVTQQERTGQEASLIVDYQIYNFCKLDAYPINGVGKTVVKGGLIQAGISNMLIPDYVLDLDVDIDKLLWVNVEVIANMDDDNSLFLPGIKSATSPDGIQSGAAFPLSTKCLIPYGTGSYVHKIGRIVISSKVPTYYPYTQSCQSVLLWQRDGTIYQRQ